MSCTVLRKTLLVLFIAFPLWSWAADPLWIDVRTPEEYAQGHVSEAINIPYEEITDRVAEVTTDRDALIYSAQLSHGFGSMEKRALFMTARASGRIESGNSKNTVLTLGARYYKTQSKKRIFFASINGTKGHALDLDNLIQLGGDTGLRGYPLRYQNGESKLLVTIEQRYFTDWYPWRLVRVGAAVFADAGRVWGTNPVGEPNLGWLKDVGFGLRFALTRSSSRKVIHLDLAFPLDGDPTIDNVQILLESRSSF